MKTLAMTALLLGLAANISTANATGKKDPPKCHYDPSGCGFDPINCCVPDLYTTNLEAESCPPWGCQRGKPCCLPR